MTTSARTYCRYCVANCGVLVDVAGDRVVGVRGDPEHPLSGATSARRAVRSDACTTIRRDSTSLRSVAVFRREQPGWSAVMTDLAARLTGTVALHGSDAVAAYGGNGGAQDGAGFALLPRFLRAVGSKGWYTALTIDSPAKALIADLLAGFSGLTMHVADDCELVLLVGTNPVISHGHTSAMADPVGTSARSRPTLPGLGPGCSQHRDGAARHPPPRSPARRRLRRLRPPRTRAPRKRCRHGVRHGTHHAVDELRRAVAPFDTRTAATISGVDAQHLTTLVAEIRTRRRLGVITGTGATMAAEANLTEWLAWCLLAITGSFERPGGMWFNPGPGRRNLRRSYPRQVRPAHRARPPVRTCPGAGASIHAPR